MIHFIFAEKDNRYLFLKFDNKEDLKYLNSNNDKKKTKFRSLKEIMNLPDPKCFLPSWGNRPKQTIDYLFEYNRPDGVKIFYCAKGLWQIVYNYFKSNNVKFDGLEEKYLKTKLPHTFEQFKEIVDSWNLSRKLRPYQYEAAWKILSWKRSTSEIATRAGKTLISYVVFRYMKEYMNAKNILMIVPSINLVQQAFEDFENYGHYFNTEQVWSGGKLIEYADMTVGTFQSLIKYLDKTDKKYNPSFFNKYDVVFVDETHRAAAKQIQTIISQPFMMNAKIAFGLTGTLPKENTIERLSVHALLGAKIQNIEAHELMEEGYISKIMIYQKELDYSRYTDEVKDLYIKCAEYALSKFVEVDGKRIKLENPEFLIQYKKEMPAGYALIKNQFKDKSKDEYIDALRSCVSSSPGTNNLVVEKMMVHMLRYRDKYILNLLTMCPRNTLILTAHTEYAKYLKSIIMKEYSDRHVEMIIGEITPKKRKKILNLLNEYNDCILIASYSILGTGITLGNLCYGILAESFKSDILNTQSLGRGLGLSDLKDEYIVYDLIDVFDTKKIYLQGAEKRKLYRKCQYPYTTEKYFL